MAKSTAKFHGVQGEFENQCEASTSNGLRRCRKPAIDGSNTCARHGGGAPQVKKAARERLAALVSPSIAKLQSIVTAKKNDPHIPVAEQARTARDILDRNGYKAKDEIVVTTELDTSRFADWSDDKLKAFIGMLREVSTLHEVNEDK